MRRATLSLQFVPLFMGSAYKNRGVQLLLDGVREFLPCPLEVSNSALVRAGSWRPCMPQYLPASGRAYWPGCPHCLFVVSAGSAAVVLGIAGCPSRDGGAGSSGCMAWQPRWQLRCALHRCRVAAAAHSSKPVPRRMRTGARRRWR